MQHPADVVVLGEALIDVVVRDGKEPSEHVGGSPANVALGLARRGIEVTLITSIARDRRGQLIARHLEESGVRLSHSSFLAERTSAATAHIAADGSATYDFDIVWRLPADLPRRAAAVVHTGSIAAFLEPGASVVRNQLRIAADAVVTFDPNIRPALVGSHAEAVATFEETAALATLVKLSDEDAEWLYPGRDVAEVLDRILAVGPDLAVVTRGGAGSVLAARGLSVEVPSERVQVVDTIGAGDTYMASLIASVLEGAAEQLTRDSLERMGRDAAHAAAITVSRPGADLPWRSELD
jgi:fructokinase